MEIQRFICLGCGQIFVETSDYLEHNEWLCANCREPKKSIPIIAVKSLVMGNKIMSEAYRETKMFKGSDTLEDVIKWSGTDILVTIIRAGGIDK